MKRPFDGKYPITQEWGVNPADYAKFGLKGHNGVDYATPTGTPILAPHDGKVIEVANDPWMGDTVRMAKYDGTALAGNSAYFEAYVCYSF